MLELFGRIAIVSYGEREIYVSMRGLVRVDSYRDKTNRWNAFVLDTNIHAGGENKTDCCRLVLIKFTKSIMSFLSTSIHLKEAINKNKGIEARWMSTTTLNLIYKENLFEYLHQHYPWRFVGACYSSSENDMTYIKEDELG
jgi:hypothetical protein